MKKWIYEGLNIFSVTTLFPLGWGFHKITKNLKSQSTPSPTALLKEHEQPILFVHGIFHNSTAFYELEKTLRRARFGQIHSVNFWTSVNHIEELAAQLRTEAFELIEQAEENKRYSTGPVKLRIIAHSLGGLITRVALLDPKFATHVDKVVFLGTPHQGTSILRMPFPKCLRDLRKNSPLIKRLQSEPLPLGPKYFNFRGTEDFVTPLAATFLPHVHSYEFKEIGHAGLLNAKKVLHSVVEILESPFYDPPMESDIG